MIITVKNLQQQTFTVEFEAKKTVLQLKEKIFKERGSEYIVEKQKLIYAGVILKDDRTIASYNVDERKFIVVLLKRDIGIIQKPDEVGPISSQTDTSVGSSGAGNGSTDSIKMRSDGAASSTEKQGGENFVDKKGSTEETKSAGSGGGVGIGQVRGDISVSADSGGSEISHNTCLSGDSSEVLSNTSLQSRAESHLLMGEEYNRSVESMIEMGYPRELVERAMVASFNNPERAVEYLISGIPDFNEGFNIPAADEEQRNIDPADLPVVESEDYNPAGADPFEFLRNQPQFLQMRNMVYQNPDFLHAVLQQIGQTNPALLQHISENQDAFLNMLNGPIDGQASGPENPRRMTSSRRAQLAAAARAAAGGDELHVRSVDTAPGTNDDGRPVRPSPGESGNSGEDTTPHDLLQPRPDRTAEGRAIVDALMRDRTVAADMGDRSSAATTVDDPNAGVNNSANVVTSPPNIPSAHIAGRNADFDGTAIIQVSSEDREAIERLKALGFPEALVLQAYFACEKDEQLAANFLISSVFDD